MNLDWIKFKKGQPDWLKDFRRIKRLKRCRPVLRAAARRTQHWSSNAHPPVSAGWQRL